MALLWAIGLPRVEKSLYFHRKASASVEANTPVAPVDNIAPKDAKDAPELSVAKKDRVQPIQLLWAHFHSAYTNPMVLQWSLWYAISLAGYLQVTTYMQVVWKSFENEPTVSIAFISRYQLIVIVVIRRLYGMGAWMPP